MADGSAYPDTLNATAQGQLRSIVERVEQLEQEKAEIAELIKEVYAEAKGAGFDAKILRKVVRIRKQDRAKRQEEEAILDLYLSALGELPLFERGPPEAEDDTRVTISIPGGPKVETTTSGLRRAAAAAKRTRVRG